MGYDPLSPVAPARVRCLLLPCGIIKRSRFTAFVDRLQQEAVIRLGDVSPDGRPHRTMFSPLAFPTGIILYELSTSIPSPSQLGLAPLELHREPLLVVGVADGNLLGTSSRDEPATSGELQKSEGQETRLRTEELEQLLNYHEGLKNDYPKALVHQAFIFDFGPSDIGLPEGLVGVPSLENSKTTTMKTIICDLTSLFLAEMNSYAKSIQALSSLDSPKPTTIERISNGYLSMQAAAPDNASQLSSSSPAPPESSPFASVNSAEISSQQNSMPGSVRSAGLERPSSRDSRSISPAGGFSTPPVTINQVERRPSSPPGNDQARSSSRDGVSVQGFGPGSHGERVRNKGKGRIGIAIGSLYLLAGRWPDAIRELVEGATIARANRDHLWHAKALDYILVCLIMSAWIGMDFEIPQICYNVAEKSNTSKFPKHAGSSSLSDPPSLKTPNAANRLVSLQNLTNLLPELVHNILGLYVRSGTFTVEQLPEIALSESAIRFAKLLTVIQLSYGVLDDEGLQHVVLGRKLTLPAGAIPERANYFLSKSDIAALAFQAFPNLSSEMQMPLVDRVTIFAGLGSILSELGFHRKKAFVLRELLAHLLPALVQSRKDGAAEMGIHPAASLISADNLGGNADLGGLIGKEDNSVRGLQGFLTLICKPYGIADFTAISSGSDGVTTSNYLAEESEQLSKRSKDLNNNVSESIMHQAVTRSFGAHYLKLDILRSCINVCEALPDLGGVVRFSADLLRTAGSGIAPGPDSGDGPPSLPVEDQVRLANNIVKTSSVADQLGVEKTEAQYWDNFLVRDIEALGPASSTAPVPRSKNDLEVTQSIETQKEKNPFIFSAFTKKQPVTSTELVVLANEEVEFIVTLQNLYEFDIEVEWLTLEHSGVVLDFSSQGTVVGPYRTQAMQLYGTPKNPGSLEVTGCLAKIKGCQTRRFPIFSAPWTYKPDKKIKLSGLSALDIKRNRPISIVSDVAKGKPIHKPADPVPSSISLKVIKRQPNLVVKHTSFSQSAIMLLEGEKRIFTVTLQNVSHELPADFLLVSFSDSTSALYQSSLAGKELSAVELYEVEYSAMNRQTFRWRREKDAREPFISPNGEFALEIEVLGQPGLSHGNIQIDYGYLGAPKSEIEDVFYTRQLNVAVTVTVNASVDLVRNDILPFTSDFAWSNQRDEQSNTANLENKSRHHRQRTVSHSRTTPEHRFQSLLSRLGRGSHGDDHCLFLLDLHNSWPTPLLITIQVRDNIALETNSSDPWKRAYSVHEVLRPGHTSRLVLLLPRISISEPYAPIPSLNPSNKRQYVVGASKSSPDSERETRETFWFREEIIKLIRGTWEEEEHGSSRRGEIDFRAIRLSPRMVDAARLEGIAISMTVTSAESDSSSSSSASDSGSEDPPPSSPSSLQRGSREIITQLSRSTFSIPTNHFLTLTVSVKNNLPPSPSSNSPLLILRLQPSLLNQPAHAPTLALDLGRKFAWHGLLQQALPARLHPGEETKVEVGFVVLTKGAFEVGAWVEEVRREGKGNGSKGGEDGGDDDGGLLEGREGEGEGESEGGRRRIWHARENCVLYAED